MHDRALLISQIVAICLTAAFGALTVFAENLGEKRLSLKGRIALTAAIISAIVALITQVLQRQSDNAKALEDSAYTQTLLKSIQRGTYPLFSSDLTISAMWEIPITDTALKPYVARLTRTIEPLMKDRKQLAAWCSQYRDSRPKEGGCPDVPNTLTHTDYTTTVTGMMFRGESRLFPKPDESIPYALLTDLGVDICIFARDNHSVALSDCNLRMQAFAYKDVAVSFEVGVKNISVDAEDMPVDKRVFESDGKIVSLPDLSEAQVVVLISDNSAPNSDVLRIFDREKLTLFEMKIGGRRFALVGMKPTQGPSFVSYSCVLPASMEYRNDINIRC